MSPQRIQRKRAKGWRMPEGAVYVGRPSKWGNPYRITRDRSGWKVVGGGLCTWGDAPMTKSEAAEWAVRYFRRDHPDGSHNAYLARVALAGKDLACWCPLDQPCHAEVLLEIANGGAV